jgi:hypothetical protein
MPLFHGAAPDCTGLSFLAELTYPPPSTELLDELSL